MSKSLECGLRSALELPIGNVQEESLIFENLILKKITMESQGLQQTKHPHMICVFSDCVSQRPFVAKAEVELITY